MHICTHECTHTPVPTCTQQSMNAYSQICTHSLIDEEGGETESITFTMKLIFKCQNKTIWPYNLMSL